MIGFALGEAMIDFALEVDLCGGPMAWLGATAELIEADRWWLEPHFLKARAHGSLNFSTWPFRVDEKFVVTDPCIRLADVETPQKLVKSSLALDVMLIPAHLSLPHAGRMRHCGHRGLWFESLAA